MISKDETVNDPARLASLRELQLLDTAGEASFDDIAKIASILCKAPVALISLVESKRQWFKARIGFDLPETPIEQSICAHALGQESLLEIPDLTQDTRTQDNALVTAPHGIRFYAGAPLVTDEGLVLGTLCVIDPAPRPGGLDDDQRDGLMALARQTMRLIAMRKEGRERDVTAIRDQRQHRVSKVRAKWSEEEYEKVARIHERHRAAEEAGRIGTFEVDIGSETMRVSAEFCRLFGLPVAETYPTIIAESLLHPDDRHIASNATSRAQGVAVRDVEYRIYRQSDAALRWIARRASFENDAAGKPVTMLGTVHDVTERRLANERMSALLELGDRLHVAESIAEAVAAAAETIGRALVVSRAGYVSINLQAGRVTVEQDWTGQGIASVVGSRPTLDYHETVAKLSEGRPIAFSDIRAVPWLAGEATSYEAVGAIAQLWVPLMVRGLLVGALFAQQGRAREWTEDEVEFAQGVADRTYATVAKLQVEADQKVLNQELSHRLKNMLAMIGALAVQTLKDVSDREAVDAFQKRLRALGTAHDNLMQQSWTGARITALTEGVLSRLGQSDRVRISGPDLTLGPRAALSLSLVLHELGTNALKYGALSNDKGCVAIHWAIVGASGNEKLTLSWAESGGPPVTEPERTGFGSQLIEMGLLGTGDAVVMFGEKGLVAEFQASLRLVQNA